MRKDKPWEISIQLKVTPIVMQPKTLDSKSVQPISHFHDEFLKSILKLSFSQG